jgi:hypothetical protein
MEGVHSLVVHLPGDRSMTIDNVPTDARHKFLPRRHFVAAHLGPGLLAYIASPIIGLITYVAALYVLVGLCAVIRPSGQIFGAAVELLHPSQNCVTDFIFLIIRSLLPTFRLEQLLEE